jgi:hypothetical protein
MEPELEAPDEQLFQPIDFGETVVVGGKRITLVRRTVHKDNWDSFSHPSRLTERLYHNRSLNN